MKKKYFIVPIIAILILLFFHSCEIVVDPPQADFYASELNSSGDIIISFSDMSSGSPDDWFWTFEGGYPSTSTERNPTVTYSASGTFDVTLVVTNEGGDDVITGYDYINVGEFYNPTWTDMVITVNNETKIIPIDDYVLFANIDDPFMSYYATTSGTTGSGSQIGFEFYWDSEVDLAYDGSAWELGISDDYVFIFVFNDGPDNLYPFYVNWANSDQTVDMISIGNDGYEKSTGYYYANDYMEIRAYYELDQNTWASWIEYIDFDLPNVYNQAIDLWHYPYKGSEATEATSRVKVSKNKNANVTTQIGIRK